MSRVEVAVVGAGMIGSSAARHLAEDGTSVAIVGPSEPDDWKSADQPFSSHYDSGRITRITATDAVWAELAARSIDRYADIEDRSRVRFHDRRGLAWIDHDVSAALSIAERCGADVATVSRDWLTGRTGVVAPDIDGLECIFERPPAGVVDPRRLIAAQLRLAGWAGADIVDSAVSSIVPSSSGVTVRGNFGVLEADRVVLATGAYGAELAGVDLPLERRLRTTLMADVGARPELPAVIATVEHDRLPDIYWVPPVRYPDGSVLLKIGGNCEPTRLAENPKDIARWFATDGDLREAEALAAVVDEMLPYAETASWTTRPCVVTNTPSSHPYIGWVDERVAIALGGNGAAAKSCDEIGRLAGRLCVDDWHDPDLDLAVFAPPV